MMKKIAWIVNYYTDELDSGEPTKDDVIGIYLSRENYEQKSFESLWRYKNFDKIEGYEIMNKFFMRLKELSNNGYEFNFICEHKTREEMKEI